ncbi:hypothetical protein [Candidatus Avelusimicrobium aviculae]|uniref:hypothetical protein n=1 Tax=Candidatus Avelusimicrobium aviculae TaxID=3416206 RepID=UPI003D096936
MDFYQWCVLVAVIAFVIMVIFIVRTMLQLYRTAESVEYLTVITAENVEKTRSAFDLVENVSTLLDSTFYRAMKLGVDLVNKYRRR